MTPPTEENAAGVAWTPEETARFLDQFSDDRFSVAWHLALITGARRGEICAARWTDFDLDGGWWTITESRVQVGGQVITKRTKTRAGTRKVALDVDTLAALRAHRKRQLQERLELGPLWQETGYLIVDELGLPLIPERLSRTWRALVAQSDLPQARLHDARHTAVSLAAVEAHVPARVLLERAGHTREATSMRYQHGNDKAHQTAAEAIAAQVRQHRKGPNGSAGASADAG